MSETEAPSNNQTVGKTSTPKHLWVVGILSFLWNSVGVLDYVMTQTKNEAYMSGFTDAQLEFFYGLPSWVEACWAIGVWGALLGSLFLLLQKAPAVWFFLASFLGMLTSTFHNFLLADGMAVMGDVGSLVFSAVIFLIALALLLYSKSMRAQGILK